MNVVHVNQIYNTQLRALEQQRWNCEADVAARASRGTYGEDALMSTRSLKNKLKKVKATLPPSPLPYEELPIEEWLAELMADPPDYYLQNNKDEELF